VERAVLGLPYFTEVHAISARQSAVAVQVLGPGARVLNDVGMAFEGALGGDDGVLILAGTGSMAWARGPKGVVRTGGYGDVFGDEGSAFWIGREALRIVSRHLDGRQRAAGFAAGILAETGDQLIDWTYDQAQPRVAVAGLAVVVSQMAAAGDRDAVALLGRAARELGDLTRAAMRAAGLARGTRWSFAGGVMGNAAVRGMIAARLGVAPVAPILPPVGGAVLVAARDAGWETGGEFQATLVRSLAERMKR
jgi:glucosamine kinase